MSTRLLEGVHNLHIPEPRGQTVVSQEMVPFIFTNVALNVALLKSIGLGMLSNVLYEVLVMPGYLRMHQSLK